MMKIQYPPEGESELMSEALKRLERLVVTCTTTGGERFTATIDEVFTDDDGWLAFEYKVWQDMPDGDERETDDIGYARTIDIELMEVV